MKNEQGTCPFCNSNDLEYEALVFEDGDTIYYPWKCNNCKREGEEWYRLDFLGHSIISKNGEYFEVADIEDEKGEF